MSEDFGFFVLNGSTDLPRLRKLHFGVIFPAKTQEVAHVESVDHGGVGFFCRHQVHVIINAAAAHAAGVGDGQCRDDFSKGKFDHSDAWQNDFDWLLDLPSFLKLPGVIIGHAALHDTKHWPYLVEDANILATLDEMAVQKFTLGFFGHSHNQEWFTKSPKGAVKRSRKARSTLPADRASAVVVGSVGQPRTGDPRAAWTLWQPQSRSIEFRRTPYPVEETMAAIKACGLPLKSARRLSRGV